MANFPASLDNGTSLPNPTGTSTQNNPDHAGLHSSENAAIIAVETKLGTGSSTPASGTLLIGTGAGTSSWSALTSAQLAAVLSDETGTGSAVFATTPTLVTPKVDTINEATGGNGVTVGGVNLKSGLIASSALAGQVNTAALQTNAVGAANLATNAITLGYAQSTTNFSTSSTSATQITGLTAAVTIPAGSRKIKITLFSGAVYNSTAANPSTLTIWDGTVGSGTQLSRATGLEGGSSSSGAIAMAVVTPAAGSKTYNGALHASTSGTATAEAAAIYPSFILVEAI